MIQFLIDFASLAGVLLGYGLLFTLIPLLFMVGVLTIQERIR